MTIDPDANWISTYSRYLQTKGTHVGGYANTGWDLVSNVVGAFAAGLVIARITPRRELDGGRNRA